MNEKQIRKAVDTIVCDALYFAGLSAYAVAERCAAVSMQVRQQSEGYRKLVDATKEEDA